MCAIIWPFPRRKVVIDQMICEKKHENKVQFRVPFIYVRPSVSRDMDYLIQFARILFLSSNHVTSS